MTSSSAAGAVGAPPPPHLDRPGRRPKIEVQGVRRTFVAKGQEIEALGPVDLTILEGEFVCVVGPSGCGKSTLLRVVAGLVPPTTGEIDIHLGRQGDDPTPPAVADASAASVTEPGAANPTAMVFQDYSIFPWKRVLENARLGLDLAGVPKKQGTERAMHYLTRLGLGDRARAYPGELSGGMKQRVAIARALAVEPEVLLMDEPFAALDAQMRHVLQDELLALWQADRRTVMFITHSLEEALLLGDRVLVMSARPGRLLADIEVPFERPRESEEVRASAEFGRLHRELWDLLKAEVDAVLAPGPRS